MVLVVRRSKRLSTKLYHKYVDGINKTFKNIKKYQLSCDVETNPINKIKIYFNIYKILKSFVKKNKINWYELRNDKNYDDVKDYIRQKLSSL